MKIGVVITFYCVKDIFRLIYLNIDRGIHLVDSCRMHNQLS